MTTMEKQNGTGYKAVREVSLNDVRPRNYPVSIYHGLYQEMRLRLEQTKPGYALALEFADEPEAKRHKQALARLFRKFDGAGFASVAQRGALVYIYRGKNWMK